MCSCVLVWSEINSQWGSQGAFGNLAHFEITLSRYEVRQCKVHKLSSYMPFAAFLPPRAIKGAEHAGNRTIYARRFRLRQRKISNHHVQPTTRYVFPPVIICKAHLLVEHVILRGRRLTLTNLWGQQEHNPGTRPASRRSRLTRTECIPRYQELSFMEVRRDSH